MDLTLCETVGGFMHVSRAEFVGTGLALYICNDNQTPRIISMGLAKTSDL